MLDVMYELPDRAGQGEGQVRRHPRGRPQGEEPLRHPPHAAHAPAKTAGAEEGKRLSGRRRPRRRRDEHDRPPGARVLPPLVAGQRLDRATFHERYEAMPPETRAELVGGVVYMPSPLGYDHGEPRRRRSATGSAHYKRFTPGVRGGRATRRSSSATTASPSPIVSSASRKSRAASADRRRLHRRARRSWSSRSRRSTRSIRPRPEEGGLRAGGRPGIPVRRARPARRSTGSSSATAASPTCPRRRTASSAPRSSPASGSTRRPSSPRTWTA